MKLIEFMKHGRFCPICQSNSMTLQFGISKQQYRYEENNVVFIREMRSIKKGTKNYNIGYSINRNTNQFQIEFYDGNKKLNFIPIPILERFKELNNNIKSPFVLNRRCTNCNKYQYWSNNVLLNYKTLSIGELKINYEYWGITKQIGSQYRVFKVDNNYVKNVCNVTCYESSSDIYAEVGTDDDDEHLNFKLEPIKFTSVTKLANKLNKLLVFA